MAVGNITLQTKTETLFKLSSWPRAFAVENAMKMSPEPLPE
jgi:hypothetical protein